MHGVLRSQREVIRDVMLAATDCDTWLTLGELRGLTPLRRGVHFGGSSDICESWKNGGYDVSKQRREDTVTAGAWADGRGDCVWEYRILRSLRIGQGAASSTTAGISQVLDCNKNSSGPPFLRQGKQV